MARSLHSVVYFLVIAVAFGFEATGTRATAQSPSKDAIIEQLNRNVKTRSIDIEELRKSVKNRIVIEDVKQLPSMSFEIFFDYNSAVIKPESIPTLVQLGQALVDERLAKFRFIVAGHTDAAGSPEYNRVLSEHRADSVRTYLVASFRLPVERLIPIGYGLAQLKDPANPLSGVNRRVEIINIGQ